MSSTCFPRLHRFVAARLSPEGETGLHLTVGVVLMVAAAWMFGGIAEDVVNGDGDHPARRQAGALVPRACHRRR